MFSSLDFTTLLSYRSAIGCAPGSGVDLRITSYAVHGRTFNGFLQLLSNISRFSLEFHAGASGEPYAISLILNRLTRTSLSHGGTLSTQALLVEVLLSAFFAVACFRARAASIGVDSFAPRNLFALTNRVERLRRSRWQWFAMVLLLVVLRLQRGSPMVAELTVLAQLGVFLALPTQKSLQGVAR